MLKGLPNFTNKQKRISEHHTTKKSWNPSRFIVVKGIKSLEKHKAS